MTDPERWRDDPVADREIRDLLRGAASAQRLDETTRRRLGLKVRRASALPAAAAGWLFVKSAAASLGVVVGAASIATVTGIIDPPTAPPAVPARSAPAPRVLPAAPAPAAPPITTAPLNPVPSLPSVPILPASAAPASSARLAAESLLLEQARRESTRAPAVALQIAAEHQRRFPQGQLVSERALIQIEALHRLGRDAEARALARGMGGGGIYAERVRQLLGQEREP